MTVERLDNFDRKILQVIQEKGESGPAELSGVIHLSPSQCSRRLQRLKQAGYISETVVTLNPTKLNLGVSAYISIKLRSQAPEVEQKFKARMEKLPEIVSCEYLTGDTDFIMKVYTRDLESYSDFISKKLSDGDEIDTIRTSIILKSLKRTTALPLDYC